MNGLIGVWPGYGAFFVASWVGGGGRGGEEVEKSEEDAEAEAGEVHRERLLGREQNGEIMRL